MTQHPEGSGRPADDSQDLNGDQSSPAGWQARPWAGPASGSTAQSATSAPEPQSATTPTGPAGSDQPPASEQPPASDQPAQPFQPGPQQYGQPQYGQPPQPGPGQYGQPPQPNQYEQPNPYGQASGYGHAPGYSQPDPGQQAWGQQQVPPQHQQQPWVPQQQQYPQQQYPQQQQYPPQQPPYGQGVAPTGAPLSQSDERLWGTLAHISIPFIGFVGPLIAYLVFKDRSAWLKATSTEALNFSILYTVLQFVCSLLIGVGIGAVLLPLVFVAGIVLCVLAAIGSNKGELYKYPVNWRLIK